MTYAPASATVRNAAGELVSVNGNGDMYGASNLVARNLIGALYNPTVSIRHAPGQSWDYGAHLGWSNAGLSGRAFLPASLPAEWRLALTASGQVGYGIFYDPTLHPRPWDTRLLLELHRGGRWLRGIAGIGYSAGYRRHALTLPDSLDPNAGHDNYIGPETSIKIGRFEHRPELALAGVLCDGGRHPLLMLALTAYAVVSKGHVAGGCCDREFELVSYQQSWGMAVSLTYFFRTGGAYPGLGADLKP